MTTTQPVFAIQRVYRKNQSFEAPNTPEIFQKTWEPKLDMHIQSVHKKIEEGIYEVILQLTVTVKVGEELAFIAEVHEAGIFTMQHFSEADVDRLVGQVCPSVLYPYIRAEISHMVSQASFPSLYLAPINFESLYEQRVAEQAQAAQQQAASTEA